MKRSLMLIAFAACFVSTAVFADMKIGVLDLNKVLAKSPQVAAMQTKLKKQFDPRGKALVSLQKKVQAEIKNYSKNSAKMKPADLKKAQQSIMSEQKTLRDKQAGFQHDLMTAQNKSMKTVLANVEKVVNKIAAQEKFNLVIAKTSTAYNDANLEITNQVIAALKK